MDNIEQRNLILLLQNDPLSSYADISKKLSITPPTAKSWIDSLFSGTKVILGVNGLINSRKIGLQNHTCKIAIHNHKEHNTFEILDMIAEIHPYTLYKNYYFGGTSGVFLQFNIPRGSKNKLYQLFDKIKRITSIDNIDRFSDAIVDINTYPEINRFKDGKWNFDFNHWINETSTDDIDTIQGKSILNKLQIEDVIIAREMIVEARRKQIDIINSIHENKGKMYSDDEINLFEKSRRRQISRRFEFVTKNMIISDYQLRYNREKFRIFNQFLFTGNLKINYIKQLVFAMNNKSPPFRSNFKLFKDNKFIWWIDLPPGQISPFTNFIYRICDNMELNVLDSSNIRSYPLWHRNFVHNDGVNTWKDSSKWMVDDIMNTLSNKFNF